MTKESITPLYEAEMQNMSCMQTEKLKIFLKLLNFDFKIILFQMCSTATLKHFFFNYYLNLKNEKYDLAVTMKFV